MHYTDRDGVRRCPTCKQPERYWEFLGERFEEDDYAHGDPGGTVADFRCRTCGQHFTVED